jgi:hypothetical protein
MMALQRHGFAQTHPDLIRVLLIFGAITLVFALIVAFGAIFGVHDAAPMYPFMPDPAGLELPF